MRIQCLERISVLNVVLDQRLYSATSDRFAGAGSGKHGWAQPSGRFQIRRRPHGRAQRAHALYQLLSGA